MKQEYTGSTALAQQKWHVFIGLDKLTYKQVAWIQCSFVTNLCFSIISLVETRHDFICVLTYRVRKVYWISQSIQLTRKMQCNTVN